MLTIILFLLAIFPIIVLGYYIYSKDSEKEPKKLLMKLVIGGLVAGFLTLGFSIILQNISFLKNDINTYNIYQLLFYCFFVVALVEEVLKFLMTYIISYHNKSFDQLYDMIVYSVFVALGFAGIENILYVLNKGMEAALVRIFFAVPTHISVAVFMGYYLSLAKLADVNNQPKKKRKYLLMSIMIPIILHGIYDFLVYSNIYSMLIILYIFIFLLYTKAEQKLEKVASIKSTFI